LSFPIFDKYNMLTAKHFDFIYFKSCLLSNKLYFSDISYYTRPKNNFLKIKEILDRPYFDCWLVGFIEAEGRTKDLSFGLFPVLVLTL